jgi:hypothetical protein
MGSVYRARHQWLGRDVAIKVLKNAAAVRGDERLRREAEATNRVHHEHIVEISDVGETPAGSPFLVMEYLEGESLEDRLAKGLMSPGQAIEITKQILRGLARAHALDVIHRDVKPGNVFLVQRSGKDFVKLLDFGIARVIDAMSLTGTGAVVGTPAYMAPEQARGEKVGPAADLYAVGCMLFEMLTGRLPYDGTVSQIMLKHISEPPIAVSGYRRNLPRGIDEVVMRAMSKRIAVRFQDAFQFLAALDALDVPDEQPQVQAPSPAHARTEAMRMSVPEVEPNAWRNQVAAFRERTAGMPDAPLRAAEADITRVDSLRAKVAAAVREEEAAANPESDTHERLGVAIDSLARERSELDRNIEEAVSALDRLRHQRDELTFQIEQLRGRLAASDADAHDKRRAARQRVTKLVHQLQRAGGDMAAHMESLSTLAEGFGRATRRGPG